MDTQVAEKTAGQKGGGGLEPDTLMPSQCLGRIDVDASLQPEKRLMLAVLEDAVGAFQKYVWATNRRGRRFFNEAEAWFEVRDADWPFAFENVCEALGLEPSFIRLGLRRWHDRQVAHPEVSAKVVRFPFRRVNGRRHSITGRPVGLRRSA